MKKRKKLIPFSLLLLINLTSCGQTIFGDSYVEPIRFTIELANSHIVDNKLTASYTDRWFFGLVEENKLKYINYSKDALRNNSSFIDYGETISWDTDYPDNAPLIEGDNYFLIRDMEYESYNYLKLELKDMEGIQLNYVGGFISVFDDTYMNESDGGFSKFYKNYTNRDDGLKMRIYFYPKTDEQLKIKNYYHYIINDFYNYMLPNLEQYLGFYYTTNGGTYGKINFSFDTQKAYIAKLNQFKIDLLNEFDNYLEETVKLEGTMTTAELRNRISKDEDRIIELFSALIYKPYTDAIEHWKTAYDNTVSEINNANNKIEENKDNIESYKKEYQDNLKEIASLRKRNEELNDLIDDAASEETNYLSIASSYYLTYNENNSKVEELKSEVSSLEEANELIDDQITLLESFLDNPNLSQENRDEINSTIISLLSEYSSNRLKINSLNSEIRNYSALAEKAYESYSYYFELAEDAADRHYDYVDERRENNNDITDLTNRNNLIVNNLIPNCEKEIEELEDLIENTLIPRREDEYDKRKYWEKELASYSLKMDKIINGFNTERRNYHESLIEKGYLKEAQDIFFDDEVYISENGLDQPDIWCFGETSYYFSSTVIEQNNYSSERHSRADVKSAFVLPFSIVNNSSMNQFDKDSLNTAFDNFGTDFTFPRELDNSYCLIKMVYPEYFNETGKWFDDLKLSLGNIHFVPSNKTFEEEKANGVYENRELVMMSDKKSDYSEE